MAKSRKLSKSLILILIILFVVIAVTVALTLNHYSKTHFTVDKWNAYEWNDRQLLIGSFLKQYDLKQMTKSEIVALLGKEPDFYQHYAIRNKTPNNLVYDFGAKIHDPAINISLVIQFG